MKVSVKDCSPPFHPLLMIGEETSGDVRDVSLRMRSTVIYDMSRTGEPMKRLRCVQPGGRVHGRQDA